MFAVLASVLALGLADDPQASAQPAAPEAPAMTAEERAAAEREAELDRVVCRREHVVGSNRPQRICMTVREWEHERDRSQEALRDDRFQTGSGRGPGESGD